MILLLKQAAETPANNPGSGNTAIVIAIIMAIASIVGTALGGWYVYNAARHNAKETRETERNKIDAASWDGWREDVETLRRQRREDAKEHDFHKKECREQIADLSARMAAQDDKLQHMDERHARERAEFRRQRMLLESRVDALSVWGRDVVSIMRAHGIQFPQPPPGVTDVEEYPVNESGSD